MGWNDQHLGVDHYISWIFYVRPSGQIIENSSTSSVQYIKIRYRKNIIVLNGCDVRWSHWILCINWIMSSVIYSVILIGFTVILLVLEYDSSYTVTVSFVLVSGNPKYA